MMAGGRVMVRVNAWVAVPAGFLAVSVSGYMPAAVREGVPQSLTTELALVRRSAE